MRYNTPSRSRQSIRSHNHSLDRLQNLQGSVYSSRVANFSNRTKDRQIRILPTPSKHLFENPQRDNKLKATPLAFSQFHKGKLLAEGKFGRVFAVKQGSHQAQGHWRSLRNEMIQAENYQQQLIHQIKTQSYLDNQHIVKLYGFFADKNNIYLIQELAIQENLYQQLRATKKKRLDEQLVQSLVKGIALGIQAMHGLNVMHRDLKPQNIVTSLGMPKICDFGWSANTKLKQKCFCGTLDYVSPQIVKGEQHDKKVDIWCLGMLTFQLLCGYPPFSDQTEKTTFQNILSAQEKLQFPGWLGWRARQMIREALTVDPRSRPSIEQMLQLDFFNDQ